MEAGRGEKSRLRCWDPDGTQLLFNSGKPSTGPLPFSVTFQCLLRVGEVTVRAGTLRGIRAAPRAHMPLRGKVSAKPRWRGGPAALERRPSHASTSRSRRAAFLGPQSRRFGFSEQALSLAWVSSAPPFSCCSCLTILWFLGSAGTPWARSGSRSSSQAPILTPVFSFYSFGN